METRKRFFVYMLVFFGGVGIHGCANPSPLLTETPLPPLPTQEPAPTSVPVSSSTPTLTPVPYVVIWPEVQETIAHPVYTPFEVDGDDLIALLPQPPEIGWAAGGWLMPGISYRQMDTIYVSGYITCAGTCTPGSYQTEFSAGTGDINGIPGTPGFRWQLETPGANYICEIDESDMTQVFFDCMVHPDRGWDQSHDYVWLQIRRLYPGNRNVHISLFGIDWGMNVITPTPTP